MTADIRTAGVTIGAEAAGSSPGESSSSPAASPIRAAAQREIRLDHLLGTFQVGSRDHSWADEYTELVETRPAKMDALIADIRANGIREPIMLGSDGRVWNGHHRICAAMHIGLDSVPVEFCAPARVTPTREQIAEALRHGGVEIGYAGGHSLRLHAADAVLALMAGLADGEK